MGRGWAAYKMRAPAALEEQMRRGAQRTGRARRDEISRGHINGE